MLFSCSALPPPPLLSLPFLFSLPSFFPLFSALILKKCLFLLLWDYVIWEEHTHTDRQTDVKHIEKKHGHTRTHTNRQRQRVNLDSSEMVDLLMAVTVRRHGWFTWTQPHLSLSGPLLPLYRGQMFTGSYKPLKQHSDRVWEKRQSQEKIESRENQRWQESKR